MDTSAFEFAATSAKQIIAFSTAVLTATATFAKDTFLAGRRSVPVALGLSWLLYLASILGAIWTLLALTGELGAGQSSPSIYGPNVVVPASIMCISFFMGICFTALAGWQAVRQIVRGNDDTRRVCAQSDSGREEGPPPMAGVSQDLPFDTIRDQLDTLHVAVANKIEREWPTQWSAYGEGAVVLQATVKVAANTYNSVRYLCAEKPPDPARKLEYAVSVSPLSRTILDSLFNVVFLFEDFPSRIQWYLRSGWREIHDEHDRHDRAYGTDPEWAEWLAGLRAFVERSRASWYVTEEEAADPSSIRWWPIPGQMLRSADLLDANRDFLQYLHDWFYRMLSSESHLALPGLMRRAVHLLHSEDREERDLNLDKYRSDGSVTTIILLLALLTECHLGLGYDLGERCKYLWTMLSDSFPPAKEIYTLRYEQRL